MRAHVKEKKESCEKKNPAQLHVVAIVEPHQSNGQTKPIRNDFSLEIIQPHLLFLCIKILHKKLEPSKKWR